jgi:hypothetical protein
MRRGGAGRIARSAGAALAATIVALAASPAAPAQGVRGGADSVRVRVAGVKTVEAARDGAGALLEIRVALDHARGFHSWPDEPVVPPELAGLNPIATSIEPVGLPAGVVVESIEWPDPVVVTVRYSGPPLELLSFMDTTVARVLVRLPPGGISAGGVPPDATATLRVTLQSCDEEYCYPPRRLSLETPLVPGDDD